MFASLFLRSNACHPIKIVLQNVNNVFKAVWVRYLRVSVYIAFNAKIGQIFLFEIFRF